MYELYETYPRFTNDTPCCNRPAWELWVDFNKSFLDDLVVCQRCRAVITQPDFTGKAG